jgi:hypothetical protein
MPTQAPADGPGRVKHPTNPSPLPPPPSAGERLSFDHFIHDLGVACGEVADDPAAAAAVAGAGMRKGRLRQAMEQFYSELRQLLEGMVGAGAGRGAGAGGRGALGRPCWPGAARLLIRSPPSGREQGLPRDAGPRCCCHRWA